MSIFKGLRGFASGKQKQTVAEVTQDSQLKSDSAWEQTLGRWEKVSGLNPNDINAKVQIILSHFNLGNIDTSNTLVEELLQEHPNDLFVKLASARHAQRVEDFDLALSRWDKLHNQHPELTEPLLSMASMKVAECDYEAAFELTNAVLKSDPKESLAYVIQGRIHHRNEDWSNALKCWDQAIDLAGHNFEAELQRTTALIKLEKYQEVVEYSETSIAHHELKTPFMLAKMKALTLLEHDSEAVEVCDLVLAQKPDNTNAAHAKAYALYRMGSYNEAEKACDYAISLDENDVQMLTLSARIAQSLAKKVA